LACQNYIPFIPLFRFVRVLVKHGGLSGKGIVHLLPWLAKLVLLEPLRWSEAVLFERRVSRTKMEHPPVFILGHYRSGTTFLQRIFSCDERFGTMNAYEQILPDMMLLWQRPLKKIMQWVSDRIKAQNHFHRVPYDWSYPGEEDLGLMSGASYYASSWGFLFPKKFKLIFDTYFRSKDVQLINGWTQDYMTLVKKVTFKNKGKPLILKSPPNTARVVELLE
jgi:omega-hydroxy-beta-dihydromenaquinone-9 sulfotransferase